MYHVFFIHSSVNGHLGCFHVLATVNSTAMNTEAHVSFLIVAFSGYMLSSGVAGSDGSFSFSLLRNHHSILHSGCINLHFHQKCSCCWCSVTQSCPTLCNSMDCSMPGFPVLHYLLEFAQTHVHWVSETIQLSHSLSLPSASALNLSHHQGLFQWVGSLPQVAKILELQLQHQSFQ